MQVFKMDSCHISCTSRQDSIVFYFSLTITCSPLLLLYRPAQLLTVSPSNKLHEGAYWLFSSQEFDKKNTSSTTKLKNKQRAMSTTMPGQHIFPTKWSRISFSWSPGWLLTAATSWLFLCRALLPDCPPNSQALMARNERVTNLVLTWHGELPRWDTCHLCVRACVCVGISIRL